MEAERPAFWSGWLPSLQQMSNALQLQFEPAPPAPESAMVRASVVHTSMRQGLGMIAALALAAGLLPFLVNWFVATRAGAAVPLVELAKAADEWEQAGSGPFTVVAETARTVAGLEPSFFPGWLAALLSALGEWINWPLRWWTVWLVYGVGVLAMTKLLGAPRSPMLPYFYALTSYAAVPLLLTGLGPIPVLGFLARLVAYGWALMIYLWAVRTATQMDTGRAILSVVLPGAVVLLLGYTAIASLVLTAFNVMF
jgi:hypothetical protein